MNCGFRISDCGLMFAQISPEQGAKLVDSLNGKDDRWLFLALLVVFMIAIAWLIKWGSNQLELRDKKLDAMAEAIGQIRDQHSTEIRNIRDKHEAQVLAYADKFSDIVKDNAKAFVIFAQALGKTPQMGPMDLRP